MITIDEMSIGDGEVAITDNNGELIAWIPKDFNGEAIVKDGYRIVTRIIDEDNVIPELRNILKVIRGGK